MLGELIQIGDKLTVKIERESRSCGYNPCPDGTIVVVVGFSEYYEPRYNNHRSPGVYENKAWAKIQDENGKVWAEWSGRLHCEDEEKKLKEWHSAGRPKNEKFLRDLPQDKFYPLDKVLANGKEYTVYGREYHWEKQPYRIYDVGHTYVDESKIVLKSRGNCWNYYHNLPMFFANIEEEAYFYKNINQSKSIPNPNCPELPYSWTLEEALEQIKKRNGDALSLSGGLFSSNMSHLEVIKFNDLELGERVAKYVIGEFKDKEFIAQESEKQMSRRKELLFFMKNAKK
jgi:hypothetical protein